MTDTQTTTTTTTSGFGDYEERVYAGVLGKLIGVYLGRPFEGWTYERIMADLGEITYYVHDRHDVPLKNHLLVVTDDDITGTFVFLRALPDYGAPARPDPGATSAQTWLNYIVEEQYDPVVGRPGQLHRAHGVPAA